MSLDWSIDKIKDYKSLCWLPIPENEQVDQSDGKFRLNPLTNGLIWATMIVGIGEITDANHREFYGRLRAWETARGSLLSTREGPRLIELAEVHAHIGLRTNVYPKTTPAAFLKRITDGLLEDADRELAHKVKAVA